MESPSTVTAGESRQRNGGAARPGAWLLVLILVMFARLAIAAGHALFETECYYWLWSRNLALGYFDHPPMLAYMVRLFDWFGPPSSLAARMHAVESNFAASLLMYYWARNLFDSRSIGIRAVILFNIIPMFSIAAVQNEPDLPLMLFWCATLAAFERATSTGRWVWWITLGVTAGGALLSKFHAFLLLGGLGGHLLFFRADRRWLASLRPYVAALIALAVYAPNFWWNANHEWLTYAFQLWRHTEKPKFNPVHLLSTLAAPFGYLSPWMAGLMFLCAWRAWRKGMREGRRGMALVFWSSAPLFLFFVAVSCRKLVKLHWPSMAFLGLCPAVAFELERWTRKRRLALYASAALLSVGAYAYLVYPYPVSLTLPGSWIPASFRLTEDQALEEDWAGHLHGLPELGSALREEMKKLEAEGAPCLIASRRFDRAATAAFYANRPAAAWVPPFGDRRGFLAWKTAGAVKGANALYVFRDESKSEGKAEKKRAEETEKLALLFDSTSAPITIEVPYRGHILRRWRILICRGFKGEPPGAEEHSDKSDLSD